MTTFLILLGIGACVFVAGIFSGCETGLYSLSRLRVQAAGEGRGQRSARTIRRLMRDEVGLLITVLLANNLVNQVVIHLGWQLLAPYPISGDWAEVVLTLLLTPPLFLLGELLPKDLFRRRPHALVGVFAPVIASAKVLLLPLSLPLRLIDGVIERLLGLDGRELARVQGREAVLDFIREGERRLPSPMEPMVRNVLELRSLRVERVMVPWRKVEVLQLERPSEALFDQAGSSNFTRLPVVDRAGAVRGYVHNLELLAAGRGTPIERHLRPMVALEPTMPLDRALSRLRLTGQRAALVGSERAPLGLVTLKDLVEEISGELHRW